MNWVILAVIAALILLYFWYAAIVSRRNAAQEAFSGIDVQLKKRTDLIPNILKIAARFMEHEKTLLTDITQLRTEVLKAAKANDREGAEKRFELEAALEDKLSGLMVAVENYPDLKSHTNMLEAQRAYADVEEHISAARRSYNAAGRRFKDAIQIFPGTLIAKVMGLEPLPFFEASKTDRAPVNADHYLSS
ncbi:MAG: LemA family protein [Vreelandella alkaliphila]|uniref:LemA family protein n=1 Tax=Halomonas campaniensis TaxID=213554 RepID=A0A3D0KE33_9GAMM|nr:MULTISPECIES: LemA family protein [unclassified Halomonas]WKD27017.1 LemA family protein [Halomonas sp. KG2]HBP41473.1 LemA family protein [Halomonas sp.]HBS82402.1 LemA family protein [Halomonas campaniensis]HCA01793.1 LemA family protein [Halomonas campaniensis]